jgi:hypothetical protein
MKEQVIELRSSTSIETDNLTIEHYLAVTRRSECLPKCFERTEWVSVARDEFSSPVLNYSE